MSTQPETKLDSIAGVRSAFHDVFGYTDPDETFPSGADDADRLAVGGDNCAMYAPEDVTRPIGVPVSECEPVTEIDYSRVPDSNKSGLSDEKRDLTVFHTNASEHTIQTWYVDMLAEVLGENHDEVHDRARIHPEYADYPVVFDVPHGHVLIAPHLRKE